MTWKWARQRRIRQRFCVPWDQSLGERVDGGALRVPVKVAEQGKCIACTLDCYVGYGHCFTGTSWSRDFARLELRFFY